jgi:hypothetical protein
MLDDPIVEEVRKIRDEYAKKFNYNLNAIAADLIKQQKASGRKLVSFPPRKPVVIQVRKNAESAVAEEKGKYGGKKNG